jgi:hypothetical protein
LFDTTAWIATNHHKAKRRARLKRKWVKQIAGGLKTQCPIQTQMREQHVLVENALWIATRQHKATRALGSNANAWETCFGFERICESRQNQH